LLLWLLFLFLYHHSDYSNNGWVMAYPYNWIEGPMGSFTHTLAVTTTADRRIDMYIDPGGFEVMNLRNIRPAPTLFGAVT
jgi:hypothetical protein